MGLAALGMHSHGASFGKSRDYQTHEGIAPFVFVVCDSYQLDVLCYYGYGAAADLSGAYVSSGRRSGLTGQGLAGRVGKLRQSSGGCRCLLYSFGRKAVRENEESFIWEDSAGSAFLDVRSEIDYGGE